MYGVLVTIHIILAGIWISNLIFSLAVKVKYSSDFNEADKSVLSLYLKYINLVGIVGSMGVLITGILVVMLNPAYGFFVFSANHWLASKQVLMVAILGVIFAALIPTAKAVRAAYIQGAGNSNEALLKKLSKINWTVNILVILNLLFALSRRMM